MKVWLVEDSKRVAGLLESAIRRHGTIPIQILPNLSAAREAVRQIDHQDVVLIDSQLPLYDGGPIAHQAGEEMVARIRAKGLKTKLIWHSRSALPEVAKSLGVHDESLADNSNVIAARVFAAVPHNFVFETWELEGKKYLGDLTTSNRPLSEFVPLSILCQGYLAIVGAAGLFPNDILDQLEKTEVGRECIAKAEAHLAQALKAGEWFAAGREKISAAVNRSGAGEEVYWRNLSEGVAELAPDVVTIRSLYKKISEPDHEETGDELHRLVGDAHRALQCLFARRYL